MKAILMAAGVGSRISKTIQKPKSTLPIGDTTIIGHTVKMLTDAGIEVAVVVGYRKKDIFRALEGLPVTYFFSPFYKVTNSMASLWFARSFLKEGQDVILANADVFWEQQILDELLADDHRIVMLGDRSRADQGDYFFQVSSENLLNEYGKNLPEDARDCEYVGIAKLKADFIGTFKDLLEEAVEQEVYELWWENVLYDNAIQYPVYVHDVEGKFWSEVDVIEDYERIKEYVMKSKEKVL